MLVILDPVMLFDSYRPKAIKPADIAFVFLDAIVDSPSGCVFRFLVAGCLIHPRPRPSCGASGGDREFARRSRSAGGSADDESAERGRGGLATTTGRIGISRSHPARGAECPHVLDRGGRRNFPLRHRPIHPPRPPDRAASALVVTGPRCSSEVVEIPQTSTTTPPGIVPPRSDGHYRPLNGPVGRRRRERSRGHDSPDDRDVSVSGRKTFD